MADPILILKIVCGVGGAIAVPIAVEKTISWWKQKEKALEPTHSTSPQNILNDSNSCLSTETLKDISYHYGLEVRNIYDFSVLLSKIEATSEYELVKSLDEKSGTIESFIQKWDELSYQCVELKPTNNPSGVNVITCHELDNLISEAKIQTRANLPIYKKAELLINNAYRSGFENFKKMYGDKIYLLKMHVQNRNVYEHLFNEIKDDLKRYLKFF